MGLLAKWNTHLALYYPSHLSETASFSSDDAQPFLQQHEECAMKSPSETLDFLSLLILKFSQDSGVVSQTFCGVVRSDLQLEVGSLMPLGGGGGSSFDRFKWPFSASFPFLFFCFFSHFQNNVNVWFKRPHYEEAPKVNIWLNCSLFILLVVGQPAVKNQEEDLYSYADKPKTNVSWQP